MTILLTAVGRKDHDGKGIDNAPTGSGILDSEHVGQLLHMKGSEQISEAAQDDPQHQDRAFCACTPKLKNSVKSHSPGGGISQPTADVDGVSDPGALHAATTDSATRTEGADRNRSPRTRSITEFKRDQMVTQNNPARR
ncbi:hypothetical protein AB0E01_32230 [Nocardia vinacea]|uniref:hypothetical protein n=1 Tax=Nocardia vinacea TaxID=96468 RepID=UPI00340C98B1